MKLFKNNHWEGAGEHNLDYYYSEFNGCLNGWLGDACAMHDGKSYITIIIMKGVNFYALIIE